MPNNSSFYQIGNILVPDYVFRSFYHALRTKGFVLLAGLSGTGKTKIFEEFKIYSSEWSPLRESLAKMMQRESDIRLDPERFDADSYFQVLDFLKSQKDDYINSKLSGAEVPSCVENRLFDTLAENLSAFLTTDEVKYERKNAKFHLYKYFGTSPPKYLYNEQEVQEPQAKSSFNDIKEHLLDYAADAEKVGVNCKITVDFIRFIIHLCPNKIQTEQVRKFYESIKHILEHLEENDKLKRLFWTIRPDFHDCKSLIGYYNPLNKSYEKTSLLNFIIDAIKHYIQYDICSQPYAILFDEMNLARVEYYFADFLSVLESKIIEREDEVDEHMLGMIRKIANVRCSEGCLIGFRSKPLRLHNCENLDVPPEIYLPPNLYFVGTVNIDESTYMFSPKVLDRVFVVEFDSDIESYLNLLQHDERPVKTPKVEFLNFIRYGKFTRVSLEEIRNFVTNSRDIISLIKDISATLRPYELDFGPRVVNDMIAFIMNYTPLRYLSNESTEFEEIRNAQEAVDLAIKMKILPKFHGPRQKLEPPLKELLKKLMLRDNINQSSTEIENISISEIPTDFSFDENGVASIKVKVAGNPITFQTKYPHTVLKILQILYRLNVNGYASFM